jgi:hypothetical protein
MKKIVATAALAVAISTPAFAQEQQSMEQVPGQAFAQSWDYSAQSPYGAYAQGSIRDPRPHLGNPAWQVYDGAGDYVGADPDPFIRNDLARDPPGRED